jgi:Na+/H+ antiporter NhaC
MPTRAGSPHHGTNSLVQRFLPAETEDSNMVRSLNVNTFILAFIAIMLAGIVLFFLDHMLFPQPQGTMEQAGERLDRALSER